MTTILYIITYFLIGTTLAGLSKIFIEDIDEDFLFPIVLLWVLFLAAIVIIGPFFLLYRIVSGEIEIFTKKLNEENGDEDE